MKSHHNEHKVTADENDERIDKIVCTLLPNLSRTKVQKMIVDGSVLLNGQKVSKHYFVEEGDVITWTLSEDVALAAVTRPSDFTIHIVHVDDDIVVVEKPAGVLTHAAESTHEWTLADELVHRFPEMHGVGDQEERYGIVHRLDRDVSGVMVLARSQKAFVDLKRQFSERLIEKEYRAIVYGVPARTHDDIRFTIARSTMDPSKMAARPESAEGRDAWTEYDLLRSHRNLAELQVRIHTGRTHQIRAHLLAIGHPVVGDALYTSKQYESQKSFARLFLHAHRLAFTHPTTKARVEFVSEIPQEFDFLMTT